MRTGPSHDISTSCIITCLHRCHLEVDAEGGTQAVGSVRGPRGVAADPIAAMARALNVPTGLPRIRNQAAGGRAGRGQAAGGAVFGGAGGRGRGRAGAGLHDNEAGAGLLAGVLQMGADEQVPAEGLLPLPALRSLRFRSGAAEAPEPEDDEEEAPPNPVELREVSHTWCHTLWCHFLMILPFGHVLSPLGAVLPLALWLPLP